MSRKDEAIAKIRETEKAFIAARESYDVYAPCGERADKLDAIAKAAQAHAAALRDWENLEYMMDNAWA